MTWTRSSRRRNQLVALAVAAASLLSAGSASAASLTLVAGPVPAKPDGYRMILIAGEGHLPSAQTGVLQSGSSQTSTSGSKYSLSILFFRTVQPQAAGGREVVEQSYSFPIGRDVMPILSTNRLFSVILSGRHSYGVIQMSLAHGKLTGTFRFDDPPFRALDSGFGVTMPARLFRGSVAQAYHLHVPAQPPQTQPAKCPSPGFEGLTGFTMDPSGNLYFVAGLRASELGTVTEMAEELPSPALTSPAGEMRAVWFTGAPSTDLTFQAPSINGSAQTTAGGTLSTAGGLSRLLGGLSFDGEIGVPNPPCGETASLGTVLVGAGPPGQVAGPFAALFDGPAALGPTTVSFWNPMRGELVYRP